ncbi:MAG: hypothetical protein NVS3B10_18790 [Polyangiales bacterium]
MASFCARLLLASLIGVGCSAKLHQNPTDDLGRIPPGTAQIRSTIPGVTLQNDQGTAVALLDGSTLELRLASGALSCVKTVEVDRLSVDLGAAQVGTFPVVTGYPALGTLGPAQARAHACPATDPAAPPQTNCDQQARSGTIVVRKLDPDLGGLVEGTFDVVFADGEVSGTFSARRCF